MIVWKSVGCLAAVALLAGTAYAGNNGCCGESRMETTTTISNACDPCRPAVLTGNPCAPCENVCETRCKVECCEVDADIEKLRVTNPKCSTDLCIDYTVDIECEPGDTFDLIVQIKCKDQIMYERIIPLDHGEPGNETGEFTYRGSLSDCLAQVINDGRNSLRAEGNVVRRGTTISIDRERERVHKTRRGHGWATPLYTVADVAYSPVGLVTGQGTRAVSGW